MPKEPRQVNLWPFSNTHVCRCMLIHTRKHVRVHTRTHTIIFKQELAFARDKIYSNLVPLFPHLPIGDNYTILGCSKDQVNSHNDFQPEPASVSLQTSAAYYNDRPSGYCLTSRWSELSNSSCSRWLVSNLGKGAQHQCPQAWEPWRMRNPILFKFEIWKQILKASPTVETFHGASIGEETGV